MGKIIRNGIKYSGTTDSANKINYDNSLSGLEAKTAQEAIDELNSNLEWKLYKNVTGTTAIDISSLNFKELLIEVYTGNTSYAYTFTVNILKDNLLSSNKIYASGYYITNTDCGALKVIATTSSVRLNNIAINGTSYSSTAVVKVYYK